MLKVNFNRKVGIELVKIYGFCGVMGSGKGYRCEQLKKEGFVQIDFADCLRNMVWNMLDWQPKDAKEYDYFKKGLLNIPGYGKINGRLLLQRIGATMREINPDFWVLQWKKEVDRAISMGYNNICCSDVRYENEIKMLQSFNWKAEVKVIFCDYHSDRYNSTNTHESELFAQKLLSEGYKDGDIVNGRFE